jgi:putative transposase
MSIAEEHAYGEQRGKLGSDWYFLAGYGTLPGASSIKATFRTLVMRWAMPRSPRYPLAGVPQHVIQRGHNRQPVFFQTDDYRVYLQCLQDAVATSNSAVHAYVLMTNHVHLLMTPRQSDSLAKIMQSIGRRYVQYSNTTYQRTGTLWEGRYRASLVEAEAYLLACYRYIELNPLRAGMVQDPVEYPWSSYRWHALGQPDPIITDHALYMALGSTPQERLMAYRALCQDHLHASLLQEIRTTLHQSRVLGTERFKDAIETVLARRVRPGKAGRPRKMPSSQTTLAAPMP